MTTDTACAHWWFSCSCAATVSVSRVVAAWDALTFDVGARVLMPDVGSGEFNLLGQPRADRIDYAGIKD